jgi:creatinine amidohydrolase
VIPSPTGPGPGHLGNISWPVIAGQAAGWLLAVPLGSTEQHGPHLPVSTDTTIARALADRLAAARADVVVAPAIAYGASGEHAGFPGTLSIGTAAVRTILVELVRSADAFAGVVIVNGHGGNAEAVGAAVVQLRAEGRRVLAWTPSRSALVSVGVPVDAHAGRSETSMLLDLAPGAVLTDRAAPGDVRPLSEITDALTAHGVAGVSPNGVLGDPTGASATEGRALLDALSADLVQAVAAW